MPDSIQKMEQALVPIQTNIQYSYDLTQEQRELLFAVETNDGQKFVTLGGTTTADLNFEISKEGMCLLLIASGQGHAEMITLMF